MSYEVRAKYPMDDNFAEMDEVLESVAGRHSSFSGASECQRDHGWNIDDFQEAIAMKDRLLTIPTVNAYVKEV